MVNLELYRIFTIVANEENITKASQILNISQPAITKHIKNLENELQISLFKRTRYGMQLTEYGKKLHNEIKNSISHLINIENEFKKSRNINLGSHNTLLSKIFSHSLKQFYKISPTTNINIINEDTNIMLSKLENQELDIIFSKKADESLYNSSKIKFIKLGILQDVFIVNNNSPLLTKILSKTDLKNEIIYTPRKNSETTINLLKTLGITNSNYIKHSKNPIMLELVKNGAGIGIISKEYIQEELKEQKISILRTNFELNKIEFGIYINKNNKFLELTNLIKIIQENITE